MTKQERAKQYIKWIEEDRINGADRVLKSINSLVYSETDKPISKEYKIAILEEMIELLPSDGLLLEHADNASVLQLIQIVKAKIESDKGSKA